MDNQVLADPLGKLQFYANRWQLTVEGIPFHTRSSWLQPVQYRGAPAMLKIAMTGEERRGASLLEWYGGQGAVHVFAHENEALLLERLPGSRSLIEMACGAQDDEASRILSEVAACLHAPRDMPLPSLIPLSHWFEPLLSVAEMRGGVFREAVSIVKELLARPEDGVVLHGDIHHGNVLDAGPRGWVAIDPKALLGERGFDFANIFCNPNFTVATSLTRLKRQVAVIAEAAGLDGKRLLAWITSWAALSAAWHIEDGEKPDTALAIGNMALNELRFRR